MCFFFRRREFSTHCNVIPPRQYMKLWAFIPLANGRPDGCTLTAILQWNLWHYSTQLHQRVQDTVSLLITQHVWVKAMDISCPVLCFDCEKQSFFWSVLGSWGRCYRDHVRPLFLTTDRATLSHQNYVPRELFGILNYVCPKNVFCPWLRFIEHIVNTNLFSAYFLPFIYRVTIAE